MHLGRQKGDSDVFRSEMIRVLCWARLVSCHEPVRYSQGQTIVDSVLHFDCNSDLVDCDCDMIFCDPSCIKLYPGSPRKGRPETGPVLVLELGCHAGVSRFACFVMTEHFFTLFFVGVFTVHTFHFHDQNWNLGQLQPTT